MQKISVLHILWHIVDLYSILQHSNNIFIAPALGMERQKCEAKIKGHFTVYKYNWNQQQQGQPSGTVRARGPSVLSPAINRTSHPASSSSYPSVAWGRPAQQERLWPNGPSPKMLG